LEAEPGFEPGISSL